MPAGFGDRETPPSGTIVAFDDPLSEIPSGWALCDGNNGTPNMLDRFPRAASSGSDPGTNGGQNSYSLSSSQMESHSHVATLESDGFHGHTVEVYNSISKYTGDFPNPGPYLGGSGTNSSETSSEPSHAHSASMQSTGADSSVDNRPEFREVAFIMKL
jgi:microcystin-dependent protein